MGSGELFNLVPFLDGQVAARDSVALTDAFTLQLDKPLVTALMTRDPTFGSAITQLLCERSRLTYATLADSSLLPLRQRVAGMLLHLASQFGMIRSDGIHLSLKVSQDQLSEYVGCSRPILNRELKQLEQVGLIKVHYSQVVILDESRLIATAVDG
jgi:CRP-like cAMP-binding protein